MSRWPAPPDLTGQTFARWTVTGPAERDKKGQACLTVRCECGTERVVSRYSLTTGASRSCGCLSIETAAARMRAGNVPRPAIRPDAERFWEKVAGGPVDECWEWQASKSKGYGTFCVGGTGKMPAHRWSYEQLIGPIPDGLFLDHLCRNRACVNPWHLEPVTNAENVRRGLAPTLAKARAAAQTHCKNQHEFTSENTRVNPDGKRACRACGRASYHRSRKRAAAELAGVGISDALQVVHA